MTDLPTLDAIRRTRERLGDLVETTPVRVWRDAHLEEKLGKGARVLLKEELFQRAGSFKPRGALTVMLSLDEAALARGVTAVSAGNHAMAVAYAAGVLGTTAKVVMPKTANPFRVERCRAMGATVELADDVHRAFARVKQIEREEGRTFVHPFEGPLTALGTATLGLELVEQAEDLDAVIVPIGGGGLCAGVAAAVKLASPKTQVFGVEPEGADTMRRSFAAGSPQAIDQVTHHRRQPGRAPRRALQLRPVPALRGRPRARERRRPAPRDAAALRLRQAGGRARGGRGHRGALGPLRERLSRPPRGRHRLRREHRPRDLRRAPRGRGGRVLRRRLPERGRALLELEAPGVFGLRLLAALAEPLTVICVAARFRSMALRRSVTSTPASGDASAGAFPSPRASFIRSRSQPRKASPAATVGAGSPP